jgi:hypothetical protein
VLTVPEVHFEPEQARGRNPWNEQNKEVAPTYFKTPCLYFSPDSRKYATHLHLKKCGYNVSFVPSLAVEPDTG